jgi:hypothetical protein
VSAIFADKIVGRYIKWGGDTWQVLATGATRDDSLYLHLSSRTRYTQQRNGRNPIQIGDYVPVALIKETLERQGAMQCSPSGDPNLSIGSAPIK